MRLPPLLGYSEPPATKSIHKSSGRYNSSLSVSFGQLTFDAEGTEQMGRFFSRHIHWPGGRSGVTIGRGYDMGQRTRLQVQRELTLAGVPANEAIFLSTAAGLRGLSAERFVLDHQRLSPILDITSQKRLFERVTTIEVVEDIRRILAKPDTVARYGSTAWSDLPLAIQELLFDLRYRGDYTPTTRARIQEHVAQRDVAGLAEIMSDYQYWRALGVPDDRIRRRAAYLATQVHVFEAA